MHKHEVKYRLYLGDSKPGDIHPHLSGVKSLTFELNERLYAVSSGQNKRTIENIIKQNDPTAHYIYDDMTLSYLGQSKNESKKEHVREISQEENDAHYALTVAANRERREAKEAELERKAIRDERQRLIDIEEAKVRAEKEARERAERMQRANELRSQGKNFQAFLVEFQNGVIVGSFVIGIALFLFISSYNKKSNQSDALKMNQELEQIEDSVKIYINNRDFDKALILANKLVHNSHEDMEQMEFDTWHGYPKFDEYWSKKREEYKKIIFSKYSLNSEKRIGEKTKVEKRKIQETPVSQDENINNESDSINNQEGLDDEYRN